MVTVPIFSMRFRIALTVFWTCVLMWQMTRVLGDAAAWGALTAPVLGTGGSVALFARWAAGYRLMLILALAVVFPCVLVAAFALGAWLSGAPMPALPPLWFPESYRWGRVFLLGLAFAFLLHAAAWYETAHGGEEILGKAGDRDHLIL